MLEIKSRHLTWVGPCPILLAMEFALDKNQGWIASNILYVIPLAFQLITQ